MIETILGFKALILAALIGGAYLVWRRSYIKKIRETESLSRSRNEGKDSCRESEKGTGKDRP
ncbi:MAG: hypothetical protein AB1921_08455 [Thermodesulfobacteriota bacterium]